MQGRFAVPCWYSSQELYVRCHAATGVRGGLSAQREDLRHARLHVVHHTELMIRHAVQDKSVQARAVIRPDEVVMGWVCITAQRHTKQRSPQGQGKHIGYKEALCCTSLIRASRDSPHMQQLQGQYPAQAGENGLVKHMLCWLHKVVLMLAHQGWAIQRAWSADDKLATAGYLEEVSDVRSRGPSLHYDVCWVDECSRCLCMHESCHLTVWFDKHGVHGCAMSNMHAGAMSVAWRCPNSSRLRTRGCWHDVGAVTLSGTCLPGTEA